MWRAAELGYSSVGVTDYNTLAGIVRAHTAAKEAGVQLLVGCRLDIDFDGDQLIQAKVANARLNIANVIEVSGSLAFSKGDTQDVVLTNGQTANLEFMTIGGANLSAFFGENAPYWTDRNHNGNVDPGETNPHSVGLAITDVDFGFAIMQPSNPIDPGRYLAEKLSAHSVQLVGIDNLQADLTHVDVEIGRAHV